MSVINGFKLKAMAVVTMLSASGVSMAAATPPDPESIITQAVLDAIATPILITMGAVVTTAFTILTFKLVTTVGMGVMKSFFTRAAS